MIMKRRCISHRDLGSRGTLLEAVEQTVVVGDQDCGVRKAARDPSHSHLLRVVAASELENSRKGTSVASTARRTAAVNFYSLPSVLPFSLLFLGTRPKMQWSQLFLASNEKDPCFFH
jgi:hypothetical protein